MAPLIPLEYNIGTRYLVSNMQDLSNSHHKIVSRKQNEVKIENLIKKEFIDGDPIQRYVNELEEWIKKIKVL